MATAQASKHFSLVLIKPSHYDDDGYVIQWLRSAIPSNTLAVMNGLALDCKERRVLGDDVEMDIAACDETNTRVRPNRIAERVSGGRGVVLLGGVQSNQYPRAMDIARKLRAADVMVCIGGVYLARRPAVFARTNPPLQRTTGIGVSFCCREGRRPLGEGSGGAV